MTRKMSPTARLLCVPGTPLSLPAKPQVHHGQLPIHVSLFHDPSQICVSKSTHIRLQLFSNRLVVLRTFANHHFSFLKRTRMKFLVNETRNSCIIGFSKSPCDRWVGTYSFCLKNLRMRPRRDSRYREGANKEGK